MTKSMLRAALTARTIVRLGDEVLAAPGMRIERMTLQHGRTSVFEHSLSVAFLSLYITKLLRLTVDERALVRGALLHDYFLYDWHRPGHGRLHGFRHPRVALENARKAFALSAVEEDVILRHMFPLGLTPPTHREGWLVTTADKLCAVRETLGFETLSVRLCEAIDRAGQYNRRPSRW